MLQHLAENTGTEISVLLNGFGEVLFRGFVDMYPEFTASVKDSFTLIQSIDNHIHIEVRKLYPDAALPM